MIETSSNLLRSSSTIFGKFSKMSGICSKRFVRPSQLFWKIFGKWSEIFGKSPETLSSAWLYKRTLHVSSKICLCSYGNNNRFTCSLRSLVRWMNEWMNVYLYTAHITHCLKAVYNSIEWDRTSACKGASGRRYRFIFDLTRPPNPCMKCTMKLGIDHHTGNYVPYSFRQVCGFFNVPCWPCNTEHALLWLYNSLKST